VLRRRCPLVEVILAPTLVQGAEAPAQIVRALRAVAGVRVARVDHNTRNLMLQVDPACGMNADDLGALLQPLGLGIRCFSRRPVGPGAFHHLDPRTCGQPPLETR